MFRFIGQSVDHLVINCDKEVIKYHCYWPIISDFINVVTHHKIAYVFMKDSDLLEKWMNFLACVTGWHQTRYLFEKARGSYVYSSPQK